MEFWTGLCLGSVLWLRMTLLLGLWLVLGVGFMSKVRSTSSIKLGLDLGLDWG